MLALAIHANWLTILAIGIRALQCSKDNPDDLQDTLKLRIHALEGH